MRYWDRAAWAYLVLLTPGLLVTVLAVGALVAKRALHRGVSSNAKSPDSSFPILPWLGTGLFLALWSSYILCLIWCDRSAKMGMFYEAQFGPTGEKSWEGRRSIAIQSWLWTVTWTHVLSVLVLLSLWVLWRWRHRKLRLSSEPGSSSGRWSGPPWKTEQHREPGDA